MSSFFAYPGMFCMLESKIVMIVVLALACSRYPCNVVKPVHRKPTPVVCLYVISVHGVTDEAALKSTQRRQINSKRFIIVKSA